VPRSFAIGLGLLLGIAAGLAPEASQALPVTVSWLLVGHPEDPPVFGGTLFTIDSDAIGPPVVLATSGLTAWQYCGSLCDPPLLLFPQTPSAPTTFVFTNTSLGSLAGTIEGGPIEYGPYLRVVDLGLLDGIDIGLGASCCITYSFAVPDSGSLALVLASLAALGLTRKSLH